MDYTEGKLFEEINNKLEWIIKAMIDNEMIPKPEEKKQ